MSSSLCPEHPPVYDEIEQKPLSVNVCTCFVTCKHHRIAVMSVYHSPSVSFTTFISELRSVLLLLSSTTSYILIAGDFNVNLLMSGSETKEYLDVLANFQLTQYMRDPSRVCDLSATLIDHVIGSNCFAAVNITQASGISDHRVQAVDFKVTVYRRLEAIS